MWAILQWMCLFTLWGLLARKDLRGLRLPLAIFLSVVGFGGVLMLRG